jgi:hypothetical protein
MVHTYLLSLQPVAVQLSTLYMQQHDHCTPCFSEGPATILCQLFFAMKFSTALQTLPCRGASHSHAPSEPPLLLDMGCYELLPSDSNDAHHSEPNRADPLSHTHAGTASAAAAGKRGIALWTPDVGKRFVQRYQHYLEHEQQQHAADDDALSTPHSHRSSDFNGFSLAPAVQQQQQLQHDEEQPYMLGSYLSQLRTSGELPARISGQHSSSHTPLPQHPQSQLHPQQQQAAANSRDVKVIHKQRQQRQQQQQQQQQQRGLQAALHRALGIGMPAKTPHGTMR